MGRGNGVFKRGRTSIYLDQKLSPVAPQSVTLGDFTGDQTLDIAATMSGPNQVFVFPGKGNGTFQEPKRTNIGKYLNSLAAANFDNDGRLDLAVYHDRQKVLILFGKNDGTFQGKQTYDIKH
jgi:hypothetical protein